MFFDNASTTKIDSLIMSGFEKINNDYFYNAGALYRQGRNVKDMINGYRDCIKSKLNAYSNANVVFTGSATEANNLALLGSIKKNTRKILVSMGEHPSIYNVALEIKSKGYNVEFVKLDKHGYIDLEDFKTKMTSDTDFVSIMHVSNETGAINDIANLVSIAREVNDRVIFHCDGVQAVGKIQVDLEELDVDMYTISAHKIHGMKGVGALILKKDVKLKPIIFGGGQEFGLRSGTENLLGLYSLNEAVCRAVDNQENNYKYVHNLKDVFLDNLSQSNIQYVVHSDKSNSPYIVSISFLGCRAETLLNMLNDKGFCVGNGSACSSKSSGNRILEAMGVSHNEIESNLRISFSKYNTAEEVRLLVNNIVELVNEYIRKVR